ncbi:MAG: sulfate adenylyltransferase subunit CysN [Acidobacteriota bacterium]
MATTTEFSIHDFLRRESEKDLLRFSTAGSVDDGKSTLIGRLLYDTQSVYEDQIRSIEGKGATAPGQIDFALLTDGLRAEREQGITIDVAYRYFSTARRKFIIADTPGHEQYTRNMATGASTAGATVVLIDATKGVLPQSRRHAYIASLLRVRHVLVAVNKMDLAGYSEQVFHAIERDFRAVLNKIGEDTGTAVEAQFIPVSALKGDNVVHRAKRADAMAWYTGPSLLEALEALPASSQQEAAQPFRFPVQRVVRPDHTFRGFAGQIASGSIRAGDAIVVQPSGTRAQVKRIVTWDGDLEAAEAPLSVTLVLDREVDISRGDLIAAAEAPAALAHRLQASIVWMDARPLELNRRYLVKHASHTVPALVTSIEYRTNIETLAHEPAAALEMNHIGRVKMSLLRPIAFDRYLDNRATGALIVIDPASNGTVAAGMIAAGELALGSAEEDNWGAVTAGERQARWGHRGALLELAGPVELIDSIERSLFSAGAVTCRLESDADAFLLHPSLLDAIVNLQSHAGILSLVVRAAEGATLVARTDGAEIAVDAGEPKHAVAAVHQLLHNAGVFISAERANL